MGLGYIGLPTAIVVSNFSILVKDVITYYINKVGFFLSREISTKFQKKYTSIPIMPGICSTGH